MKKLMLAALVVSLLGACSKSYDQTTAPSTDGAYYSDPNNPYATGSTYGNEFSGGSVYGTNPYGTGSGSTYGNSNTTVPGNDFNYGSNNNVGSYSNGRNNSANGDYYQDPNYGKNVQAGPKAVERDRVIYFSYDSSAIDQRAQAVLRSHANYLRANPTTMVILEGHTDERGTRDYNIALGERRAFSVKNQFQALGVNTRQMRILSYGEERPAVWGSDETSYAKNRRVVITY